jgi:hypothetical protein
VVPTVAVEEGGGGGEILLASDWGHATGNGFTALDDGGYWDEVEGWQTNAQLTLNVITSASAPAPFRTTNVLRITMRGSLYNGNLAKQVVLPSGGSTYGEVFVLNGGDTQTHNHPFSYVPSPPQAFQAIPYGMTGTSSNWYPFVRFDPAVAGSTADYPFTQFQPGVQGVSGVSTLDNNVWYRYRYHLHHYDAGNPLRYRIYPYVYAYDHANPTTLGTALFTPSTFFQQDYTGGANGNLQAHYNSGNYFLMDDLEDARTVTFGQEGSAGASDTGAHWYAGDLSIRSGDWGAP